MLKTLFFKKSNSVSETEHLSLRAKHEALKGQYENLQRQLLFAQTTHKDIPLAGFDSLEIEPTKTKDRQQYIADVTTFFDNIFHKKIKVSIAEIRELLSNIGRQEDTPLSMSRTEYDMFLRGMEAALWKMHDWAIGLDAERKQVLQDTEDNN